MSTSIDEADIVIVGGGPIGLMLAIELRLGGADPIVLERLPRISDIPKGNGLVGQVVPMLDYRGLLDRILAEATVTGWRRASFGPVELNFSRLRTCPMHMLTIPQRQLEQVLEHRLAELGGTIRRGHELITLAEHDDAVTLDVRGPAGDYQLRARYLVGCDGVHSLVRKQAGIGFLGTTSTDVSRIGRVRLPTAKATRRGVVKIQGTGRLKLMRLVRTPRGTYTIGQLAAIDKKAPPDSYIIYTSEDDPTVDLSAPITIGELSASAQRVIGGELPMTNPERLTRHIGNSRLAERYRSGRIFLAGDAAHIFGASGSLNTGLLDAVNLGWKLAAQVQDRAADGLLDSYHAERHLAGEHAIRQTRAQKALTVMSQANGSQPGAVSPEGMAALREMFGDALRYRDPVRHIRALLRRPEQLRRIGEVLEGSDVRYPVPDGSAPPHPLLGKLAPDLQLETGQGRTRVAELMRPARSVLLNLTAGSAVAGAASDWPGQLTVITARCLSQPAPAAALLIRPDGYIAWATEPGTPDPATGLSQALRAWLSPVGRTAAPNP